ncbi:hypothetical protein X777_07466, partial [Ooceraea biroi]
MITNDNFLDPHSSQVWSIQIFSVQQGQSRCYQDMVSLELFLPVATFGMDKVALSSTDKFGLRVFAYSSDMSLRIYYANDAEAGRFRLSWIRKLSLLKLPIKNVD